MIHHIYFIIYFFIYFIWISGDFMCPERWQMIPWSCSGCRNWNSMKHGQVCVLWAVYQKPGKSESCFLPKLFQIFNMFIFFNYLIYLCVQMGEFDISLYHLYLICWYCWCSFNGFNVLCLHLIHVDQFDHVKCFSFHYVWYIWYMFVTLSFLWLMCVCVGVFVWMVSFF